MKQILLFISLIFSGFGLLAQVTYPVTVSNFQFSPSNLVINQGDIVQWNNVSGVHNINGSIATFPSNPQGFMSGAAANAPWTFNHTFTVLGSYNYHCDPHAGIMAGTITVNGALPVELKYITASVNGGVCKVEWATEKEENLQSFVLQKSKNATDFTDIIKLDANHVPSTYNYFDDMGAEQYVYYRVKITDNNNSVKYTPIRLAQNDLKITKNSLTLIPNPYVDHFHISVQSVSTWAGEVAVYDFAGRTLHKAKYTFNEGNNYMHLENTDVYPKGVYLVTVRNNNNKEFMSATVVKE